MLIRYEIYMKVAHLKFRQFLAVCNPKYILERGPTATSKAADIGFTKARRKSISVMASTSTNNIEKGKAKNAFTVRFCGTKKC